jgi:hypothetical protein
MTELHCPKCGRPVKINTQGNLIPIEIDSTDTIFARIRKFNELIEPQLAVLENRELELATTFLIGYLRGHLPVEKIEEISRELKKFIERDL